jgi:uncharacterized SAM-binding protein YcdF (DUF218 family)
MEWWIINSITALLLPPGCLLAVAVAGVFAARWKPRLGRSLVALSLVLLYAFSMPYVAGKLVEALEPAAAERNPVADRSGQAIVVLGGGAYFAAPEYGRDTVGTFTLARLRYAAHLHRELGTPILVTGGAPLNTAGSEAELMKQSLSGDFRIPVKWSERESRNTLENARYSYRILSAVGVRRIYLVTSAWHMPRARLAFEAVGFTVIPAGTGFRSKLGLTVVDFLPNASALSSSSWLFHEVIGIGWYHLRLRLGR